MMMCSRLASHLLKRLHVVVWLVLSCAGAVAQAQPQPSASATATAHASPAPAASPSTPPNAGVTPEYRLGAGDVIRISVYQNTDLSLDARISEVGVISYPLLGSVRLGGLTMSEAERRIAEGLRSGDFVKHPQVSVLVVQVRGNQASVLGQVNRPGRFPLEAADTRLTDLLATAGGVAATGSETVIIIGTRDGKPFRAEIDLPSLFAPGHRSDDAIILNGDVIWVDRAPMVYIYGEVQRPGAIRLERRMTVMQALASGGGLTQRGTERGLRVSRRDADGKMQVIEPSMEDELHDSDVVYVHESLF